MECKGTIDIWYKCYSWFKVHGAVTNNITDQLKLVRGLFFGKKGRRVGVGPWVCIIWRIWKSRNELIFEGKEYNLERMFEDIRVRLWSWVSNVFPVICSFSFGEWLSNPRFAVDAL